MRIRPAPPPAGAGGGVWKSRIHRFGPLGIEVEKQGFRTAWLITGRKFPLKKLKPGSSLLTFRDPSSHICEKIWIAKSEILDPGKSVFFQNTVVLHVSEKWDPDIFPKSQIFKISCSSHSKNAHIKLNLDS